MTLMEKRDNDDGGDDDDGEGKGNWLAGLVEN
jgi:hypothetical protein